MDDALDMAFVAADAAEADTCSTTDDVVLLAIDTSEQAAAKLKEKKGS